MTTSKRINLYWTGNITVLKFLGEFNTEKEALASIDHYLDNCLNSRYHENRLYRFIGQESDEEIMIDYGPYTCFYYMFYNEDRPKRYWIHASHNPYGDTFQLRSIYLDDKYSYSYDGYKNYIVIEGFKIYYDKEYSSKFYDRFVNHLDEYYDKYWPEFAKK